MPDREKVIEALRLCRENFSTKSCRKCPYMRGRDGTGTCYPIDAVENGMHLCWQDLVDDAIALLREQEPRVMTLEELRIDADESVVCWVEFASKSAVNVTAPYRGMAHICLPFLGTETITFVVERNYGEKWRCWTSRPTPDQMRDTPWEGEKDA